MTVYAKILVGVRCLNDLAMGEAQLVHQTILSDLAFQSAWNCWKKILPIHQVGLFNPFHLEYDVILQPHDSLDLWTFQQTHQSACMMDSNIYHKSWEHMTPSIPFYLHSSTPGSISAHPRIDQLVPFGFQGGLPSKLVASFSSWPVCHTEIEIWLYSSRPGKKTASKPMLRCDI